MVARTLALRGWQVTVLEQQAQAGAGASGLPAGLVSASGNSPADPLYGITRSAYHLTRQILQSMLVQGEDWDEGGAMRAVAPGAWRAEALWLKPQALIRACLSTPGVTLQCEATVQRLHFEAGRWQALDARGHALASSELLVLCNAMDAARLLAKTDESAADALSSAARRALTQLHPVFGSISSGPATDLPGRPGLPVQGQGHFLPAVPSPQGLQWLAGAGFEADDSASEADCHQANLARITQLLPDVSPTLQAQYRAGQLGLWRGQRCVSHDRLPLIGPATASGENGLWMCLAMGARGLTFAALCAQLLTARLMADPLPLPKRLARLLDAQRSQGRGS
jgi:tRNA 5-methylaminomethyl-2-thiouridine biosynthesis bifunctional protein